MAVNEEPLAGHGQPTDLPDESHEKNDLGPERVAPVNPKYDSSFDEFAGVFIRDDSELMADRSRQDYKISADAYDFGYRMAADKRFAQREWAAAEPDLQSEWDGDWGAHQAEIQKGWKAARGMG